VRRLADKAPGRVEKVRPALTSQRCSACGQVDRDSRESLGCLGDAVVA
jgi:putative transposase